MEFYKKIKICKIISLNKCDNMQTQILNLYQFFYKYTGIYFFFSKIF